MTPLTARQKRIVLIVAIVIAATRLLALARSLNDWDEALFSLGVKEYDVSGRHHPHPPGYPLFVAAAKVVHLAGAEEFRSLQVVVCAGAMLLFPALFAFARQLGFRFEVAVLGSAVFAFFPNVWIYGGTAFSDVPTTALLFAACALLLRGRNDSRFYVAGAIVLGIATGFRTTSLLVGLVPSLMATWHRLRARAYGAVALGIAAGAVIVAGSYLGAALASGTIEAYLGIIETQRQWVRNVDSWRSPVRPPLPAVARDFFLRPFRHEDLLNAVVIFGAFSLIAAIVRKGRAPLLTAAVFAPLALTTWLNFDVGTSGRYAISFMAAHALLATDGFFLFGAAVSRGKATRVIGSLLGVALIAIMAAWAWPALRMQRTTDSPVAAAFGWVARNAQPGESINVHAGFEPHVEYFLPGREARLFEREGEIPPANGRGWVVHYGVRPGAHNFVWPHKSLWGIIRQRNFETSVGPAWNVPRYLEGWYDEEGTPPSSWRWMKKESRTLLEGLPKEGRLHLRMEVPLDAVSNPEITVEIDGRELDRFVPSQRDVDRSWVVPSTRGATHDLRITTSEAASPIEDPRELGLRVLVLTWTPAE